jgi:hypothetical protein
MIREWLETYNPQSKSDAEQALREVMQEIALAGLQRSGFFEKAAFYGGSALRIFHGLQRFSEDLDFSLLEVNAAFSLEPYLAGIVSEFAALGVIVRIEEKKKSAITQIDSAFLKPDTNWNELLVSEIIPQESLNVKPILKIKIEVDKRPPFGFETEEKLLLKPFSFYVKCYTLPNLFAGKMHALLFRNWKDRVKGRDWFDMEWYIRKGIPLNLHHLHRRSSDSGHWKEGSMTKKQFDSLLIQKIQSVSIDRVREDIIRFIPDKRVLDIWSKQYFIDLTEKIVFVD